METALEEARVVYCEEEDCGGLVKPDIVFFGESVSSLSDVKTPIWVHFKLVSAETDTVYLTHTWFLYALTYSSTRFWLAVCLSYRKRLGRPLHL